MATSLTCRKCQGVGIRAARMKRFVVEGQELRCLAFVSWCMTCGYSWEDEMHETENLRQQDYARNVASSVP
jgi:hypothetical protein